MATLAEIKIAVRELSFDRFPTPIFVLKAKASHSLTITSSTFVISTAGNPVLTVSLVTYDTLQKLSDYLITSGYPIAFTGYFRGEDASNTLMPMTDQVMTDNVKISNRFFFSNNILDTYLIKYMLDVLRTTVALADLDAAIQELDAQTTSHMSLFVACMLIDNRRLSEYAYKAFGVTYFSDGSGSSITDLGATNYDSITVNIGSVFSLNDDYNQPAQSTAENWDLAGSEDFFNDKEGFWFKLFCWLRDKLEVQYRDYTFRKDSGVWGNIILDKPLNYRAYFDSYPFTISPLGREIIR